MRKPLILSLLLLPLAGCDGLFSLEEEPKTFLSEQQFYRNAADAEAAVTAIYEPFRNIGYYDRNLVIFAEGLADHADTRGSWAPPGRWECDNLCVQRMGEAWSAIYRSINRANSVLARVPKIPMDEGHKARLLAEAKFLRALNYLNLVRYWGGVPLRVEAVSGLDQLAAPRATADEVYRLILTDLQEAESVLPDTRPVSQEGRPTKWGAKGLLADIHLGRENWAEAAAKAREVIESGRYSLVQVSKPMDFHAKLFGPDVQGSPEMIHVIKFMHLNGRGTSLPAMMHHPAAGYSAAGYRGIYGVPKSWMGSWDTQDLRRQFTLYGPEDKRFLSASEPIRFKKFMDPTAPGAGGHGNDFSVLRYPDILLILAEATAMAGAPNAAAYDAVNQVRRRAYGMPLGAQSSVDLQPGLSQAAFRDAVLLERAKEFVMEIRRFWDLKRTGQIQEKINATGDKYDPKFLAWPIPQEEIDTNEALTQADQNPGW